MLLVFICVRIDFQNILKLCFVFSLHVACTQKNTIKRKYIFWNVFFSPEYGDSNMEIYFGNIIDRVLVCYRVYHFFIIAERPSDVISLQNELLLHLNFSKLHFFKESVQSRRRYRGFSQTEFKHA